MPRLLAAFLSSLWLFASVSFAADNPRVKLSTSHGEMVLELAADKVPVSVANFLQYVDTGFYSGTIFHRVIKGFMIQGGGFTAELKQKDTRAPIKNEADNGLKNRRGAIAMARTGDPHSATAQFFINSVDNNFLDHRDKSMQGWGYTVFGHVVEGLETLDRISALPTHAGGPFSQDLPKEIVVIKSITRLE